MAPSTARWSTASVQLIMLRTTTCPLRTTARSSPLPTARIMACGGWLLAAKLAMPRRPSFGVGEATALELVELELAGLGAGGEVLHLRSDLRQALHVGAADDGCDKSPIGGDGDRDIDRPVVDHLVLGPRGVAFGMITQGLGA